MRIKHSAATTHRSLDRRRLPHAARWWAHAAPAPSEHASYWSATRRPFPSLVVVLPLLLSYEACASWLAHTDHLVVRTGVDLWLRSLLGRVGLVESWLPPVALLFSLVAWQMAERSALRIRPGYAAGMLLEGALYALVLLGLSRAVDIGLSRVEQATALQAGGAAVPQAALAKMIGYIGAGVYEEAIFRLLLIPLMYGTLRALLVPKVMSGALAIAASSCLFSLAHHAGAPGEAFTWFAFVFRWLAGFYFAWIFVLRGFGVVVATHVLYDCLVGLSAGA